VRKGVKKILKLSIFGVQVAAVLIEISHRFHGFTQIFWTLISQITQRGFSQLGVLGGGFSRCEHLRKPAVFVHDGLAITDSL
jgi:hypothetical protein